VFQTLDRESWSASQAPEPAQWEPPISLAPEFGARTRPGKNGKLYAFGQFVYSSWSGANWDNLTAVRVPGGLASLVGRGIVDLAASPRDTGLGEEELAIAGEAGVFRSIDGGKSWSAINAGLPNFPGRRIAALPNGDRGVQVETSSTASRMVEWVPGERQAWRPTVGGVTADEISLRMALSASALKVSGPTVYYGFEDGTIRVSTGQVSRKPTDGRIANLWADQGDPRIAMAAVEGATRRVLRTIDGGLYWEDISTNLPAGEVHGVAASRSSRAVYVATDQGIFQAEFDVENLGAPPVWRALSGLPAGKVWDVRLDQGENRLWALTDGTGIFTTLAPHRYRDPRVLSSADFVARAAAPGALFSVAGAKISSARSGDIAIPILNASDSESQIQIPFEARGNTLSISIDSASGRRTLASLLTATTSTSPCAAASCRHCTCPTCKRSNQPLVNTIERPPARCARGRRPGRAARATR